MCPSSCPLWSQAAPKTFLVAAFRALLLALTLAIPTLQAHVCGPALIEVPAGETRLWRITADRLEVASDYQPFIAGPDGVASIFPQRAFKARHGDFMITGLTPGTNTLSVNWFYSGTGASGRCTVTVVVRPASATPGQQTAVNEGDLTTTYGPDIPAERLHALLDFYIPTNSLSLFIFTQCYGGNIAFSQFFRNRANLAIASATSPNQLGRYGGYHDDAATALRPQNGLTALDVHETASTGKATLAPPASGPDHSASNYFNRSEFPRIAGGLSLADFSLQSISATSSVRSRHILVFMGDPGAKTNRLQTIDGITIPSPLGEEKRVDDTADRDRIKANFAGQPNTTVHTVGGTQHPTDLIRGQNGWDYRGDFYGLRKAFEDIQQLITNSPNPSAEQFILFVGDHGGGGTAAPLPSPAIAAPASATGLISNFHPIDPNTSALGDMLEDLDNTPGFQVSVPSGGAPPPPVSGVGLHQIGPATPFPAGSIAIQLNAPGLAPVLLHEFEVLAVDIDNNGVVGNLPSEGYEIFFPIPESTLLALINPQGLSVTFHNALPSPIQIDRLTFKTGAVARTTGEVPPPRIASSRINASGQLELIVAAVPGFPFQLERSTDLRVWTNLRQITFTQELTPITETPPAGGKAFYRFKSVPF